ncbi:uncharacterized protein FMAN_06105 [Fusarium mangiferae]|uniref:Uncharacterized protein n=1 Tax=Fusarium mangiferae TaxID=192010 RepID=A0A1L7STS3_FUSMA|nr:uncharacterized protein FMAN_06105 [Fusarium mangiferae]CVK86626.1 uncharacterized protein FMAN_06105 [Fusarium mangiferae]
MPFPKFPCRSIDHVDHERTKSVTALPTYLPTRNQQILKVQSGGGCARAVDAHPPPAGPISRIPHYPSKCLPHLFSFPLLSCFSHLFRGQGTTFHDEAIRKLRMVNCCVSSLGSRRFVSD